MAELLYSFFIQPIVDYDFMQRAFFALLCLSISSPCVGVFLVLKKMSLSGDAISHSILPGAAIGFLSFGLSITAMTIGGIIAGAIVTIIASVVSRVSKSSKDNILSILYLFSLALGVLIVSISGSNVDLMHFLFGSVLALNNSSLILLFLITCITIIILPLIVRALIIDTMDPLYFASVSKIGVIIEAIFMTLTVLNLVSGFQTIGTLMSVGIMVIPTITSRFWTSSLFYMFIISIIIAILSSYIGLLSSFYYNIPTSSSIIITISIIFFISLFIGVNNGIIWKIIKTKHYED